MKKGCVDFHPIKETYCQCLTKTVNLRELCTWHYTHGLDTNGIYIHGISTNGNYLHGIYMCVVVRCVFLRSRSLVGRWGSSSYSARVPQCVCQASVWLCSSSYSARMPQCACQAAVWLCSSARVLQCACQASVWLCSSSCEHTGVSTRTEHIH